MEDVKRSFLATEKEQWWNCQHDGYIPWDVWSDTQIVDYVDIP